MRIENQNIGGVGGTGSFGSIGSIPPGTHPVDGNQDKSADTVKLSSASSLIALAKNLNSADKQSRVAALTAQVRSGSYQADLGGTSRAIIAGSR